MFCRHCGNEIDEDVVVCTKCGKQVKELKSNNGLSELVNDTNAWYFETWFIILMIIFVFPVGIILLVLKLNNK